MSHSRRDHRALCGRLMAILLVLVGCGHAQQSASSTVPVGNSLSAMHERGVLQGADRGDYRPFTYHDPATGGWGDRHRHGSRLGAPVGSGGYAENVATTWARMVNDLTSGRCDIAMGGISVTPDRAARASYSDPYLQDGKTPITTCAHAGRFQTLSQINKTTMRVIVNPGKTDQSYDRQMLKRATIVTFPDNNTSFDSLLDGQADLMLTDASEARWQAAQHPGSSAR